MTILKALLRACVENPADDAPRHVLVCSCRGSSREIDALGSSDRTASLTHLNLSGCSLGSRITAALVASPLLGKLTSLTLEFSGAEWLASLATSPRLAGLRELGLQYSLVGDKGARALASSPYLTGLLRLDLRHNGISGEGAAALSASESLSGLHCLRLAYNDIDPGASDQLRQRFGDRVKL